jgi:ABC-type polysaccharide/polyol phosphate transport system ATPase subunit
MQPTIEASSNILPALEVANATFEWASTQTEIPNPTVSEATFQSKNKVFKLEDLDLTVQKGKLISIVGPVGSIES